MKELVDLRWMTNGASSYDSSWRLEVVRTMIDREARVAVAHWIAFATLAFAILLVSNKLALALALAFRLLSLLFTRYTASRLKSMLEERAPIHNGVKALCAAMLISGASWASLLLSLDVYNDSGAARIAVAGVVLVGTTLVIITFGAIAEAMVTFVASLMVSLSIGNLLTGSHMPWMMIALIFPLLLGPAIFGLGWARNVRSEAKLKIDHRQLSVRLLNALEEAHHHAHHDPLTGLSNRRAFFAEYDVNLSEGSLRSFVTIDLDNFKEVNDQLGHQTGDALLLKVANVMTEIRDDLPDGRHSCVRLGGDEFVLVLDRMNSAQAQLVAERLRARIKQIPASSNMKKLHAGSIECSASIGVAQQQVGEELDAVLSRSDCAMYQSKTAGRNQVTLATCPLQQACDQIHPCSQFPCVHEQSPVQLVRAK